MSTTRVPVVVVLLLMASCRAPLPPAASPTRAPELAASADAFTPSGSPSASPSARTSDPTMAPSPASSPVGNTPPSEPSEPTEPSTERVQDTPIADPTTQSEEPEAERSFRTVGVAEDPAGDQGLEGPDYADVRRVTIEDDGQRARVRVEVGGTLPRPPADGEVIGIGVDLLRDNDGDSSYQLFADGGADGWFAYLQTPDGFVRYTGEFRVGGGVVEFVIPWDAIGSPAEGPFRAFLDWSRRRPVVNAAAEDHAPDSGSAGFDRS